jgi:sulfide:quinone oxidoreductase
MKNLLILGAGTAGTLLANKLKHRLESDEWIITVVDRSAVHYYQPGFLFLPFGLYQPEQVVRPRRELILPSVEFRLGEVEQIEPAHNRVRLSDGTLLEYDFLVIATGARVQPEETEGLKGELWRKSIFDFYTFDGAMALADKLKTWPGGKLVVNITEMPIKCPVAPLEFLFLADEFFTHKGLRNQVELRLVTPLTVAFTKPKASEHLGHMLTERNILVTPDFNIASVDNERRVIVSWDEQEVPFDLLVTIPTNKGDAAIERSGLGDELGFVPTDKYTLRSSQHPNIFAIGDATNLPASKAGSVAHFEGDILVENLLCAMDDKPLTASFDGHANCFIESGFGKGLLIDFNYDTEPLPGVFPLPGLGPFSLLAESPANHLGKLAFRWLYWNLLLQGHAMPFVESHMSLAGKQLA